MQYIAKGKYKAIKVIATEAITISIDIMCILAIVNSLKDM